jgi:hypothetical protein
MCKSLRVPNREPAGPGAKERESLSDAVTHIVEEARMLIPGVTAFLGFQLVAVFNTGFSQKLTHDEQVAHVAAMFFTLIALLMLLTPAAYHRQAEPGWVSQGFADLSSRLITGATPLFALGMTIDFYLLVRAVAEDSRLAGIMAALVLAVAIVLWYVLPRYRPLERLLRGG